MANRTRFLCVSVRRQHSLFYHIPRSPNGSHCPKQPRRVRRIVVDCQLDRIERSTHYSLWYARVATTHLVTQRVVMRFQ